MSTTNLGTQVINWKYKTSLKGSNLSKMFNGCTNPGIYLNNGALISGNSGIVVSYSGGVVIINPFEAVFKASATQTVHIGTTDNINLSTDGGCGYLSDIKPYITMSYTWADSIANYIDFEFKVLADLTSKDIIIGKGIFTGAVLTSIDYSEATYPPMYNPLTQTYSIHNSIIESVVATGRAPLTVSSATVVNNLNADMIDSKHWYDILPIGSNFHHRKDFNKVKNAAARTTLVISDFIETVINGAVYYNRSAYDIDIDTTTCWDNATYATPANRAGKDFYIYACTPPLGETFDIKLSANSTYPTGYTAINSRKIGGFHCLCVSAGTAVYGYINEGKDADYLDAIYYEGSTIANGDTSHWLKNFVQGDILPFSCWDLEHRPNENADVEGKVYDPKSGLWVDIYLPSWSAGLQKLLSVYGGTIADGTSSPAFHWYRFSQVFANQGQRLPRQDHFVACSLGSPQGVNISTSADPITTGGHTATDALRIISNIGVEDGTGVLWQWGSESGTNTATAYTNAYDANDKNVAGQQYSNITRPFFGGAWSVGVICGSRGSAWFNVGLFLSSGFSGRGFAEPK